MGRGGWVQMLKEENPSDEGVNLIYGGGGGLQVLKGGMRGLLIG